VSDQYNPTFEAQIKLYRFSQNMTHSITNRHTTNFGLLSRICCIWNKFLYT